VDFHGAISNDDLVYEVSAKAHLCIHAHALEPTGEGATDLVDIPLELREGHSLSGSVGHLIDGPLDALQPPLDGSPAADKLFEFDRLLLISIDQTPALDFGIADLTFQSA